MTIPTDGQTPFMLRPPSLSSGSFLSDSSPFFHEPELLDSGELAHADGSSGSSRVRITRESGRHAAVDWAGPAGLVGVAHAVAARLLEDLALSGVHSRGTRIDRRGGEVRRQGISCRDVAKVVRPGAQRLEALALGVHRAGAARAGFGLSALRGAAGGVGRRGGAFDGSASGRGRSVVVYPGRTGDQQDRQHADGSSLCEGPPPHHRPETSTISEPRIHLRPS